MRLLEQGFSAEGGAALTVSGETDPATLDATNAQRITVTFGGFRDGRGFSLASILRAQGFAGELRATGDLLPDHRAKGSVGGQALRHQRRDAVQRLVHAGHLHQHPQHAVGSEQENADGDGAA